MESILAGLALVIFGLAGVFFGYRLFRILLPIYGAVFGFVAVWGWLGESAWLVALVVGVVLGVILGALAYTIWSAYVAVAGGVFGLALGSLISSSLNLWTWLAALLTVVLAVGFGLLFIRVRNEMVIVATALAGAAAVARGVGEWLGLSGGFDPATSQTSTGLIILMGVIFLFLAVIGIWFQWGRYHELRDGAKGAKATAPQAATPPAPATRAAAIEAAPAVVTGEAPVAAAAAGVAVAAAVTGADEGAGAPVALAAAEAETQAVAEETAEAAEVAPEVVAAEEVVEAAPEPVSAAEVVETAAEAAAPVEAEGQAVEAAVVETAEAATDVAAIPAEVSGAGAAAAAAAVAIDNKAEEVPATDLVEQPAMAAEDLTGAADANVVESVVKEIEETYSFEDLDKFKEKLEYVEGIGPVYAEKLRAVGVNTVLDLLRQGATRRGRAELVEHTGISSKLILRWINHADLYRIKGVGSEYADLLEAAGVDTVVELGKRNPANLLNSMVETNKVKSLVRKEPVASQVEDWVAQARKLPRVIQY